METEENKKIVLKLMDAIIDMISILEEMNVPGPYSVKIPYNMYVSLIHIFSHYPMLTKGKSKKIIPDKTFMIGGLKIECDDYTLK